MTPWTSVVSYHTDPERCGVARLSKQLADRLGVPLVALDVTGSGAWGARPLFSIKDENGRQMADVPGDYFDGPVAKINTAHMGCMMFRVKALSKCKKPWILEVPDRNGGWEAGQQVGITFPPTEWWGEQGLPARSKRAFVEWSR